MSDSARLPGSHAWPGLPAPYHRWFRQVDAAITGGNTATTDLAAITQRVADLEAAAGQQPVLSVFNRTGVVQAARGDYAAWYQPKDATLAAFAALTIAADSLTVGTGADAFSQVTFAANTFPAKASAGSLSAKPITDYALTLLDDADAATARATLDAEQAGTAAAAVAEHEAAGNPHPQYLTEAEGDAAYDALGAAAAAQAASQPLDGTLTALAGLNATAGLVEQTGADAFTKRAIGVATATDILTRAGGDGRYDAIGAAAAAQTAAAAYTDSEIADAVASGTYTPTLTNTANISSSTAYAANYLRVGNTVTVSGQVDITCTANSSSTELRLSLPVAATFTAAEQASGVGSPGPTTTAGSSASIVAHILGSADVVRLRYLAGSSATSSRTHYFHFTYHIP